MRHAELTYLSLIWKMTYKTVILLTNYYYIFSFIETRSNLIVKVSSCLESLGEDHVVGLEHHHLPHNHTLNTEFMRQYEIILTYLSPLNYLSVFIFYLCIYFNYYCKGGTRRDSSRVGHTQNRCGVTALTGLYPGSPMWDTRLPGWDTRSPGWDTRSPGWDMRSPG